MNQSEIEKYKAYLFSMTDEQLDAETYTVVKQANSVHDDMRDHTSMMIQHCYNDWRRRGQDARFLKAYNKTLEPIEKDFH